MNRFASVLSCFFLSPLVFAQAPDVDSVDEHFYGFKTGIQSTDEVEFEKARASFLNRELKDIPFAQIRSVIEPLIWPRNHDQAGQIRQGKLVAILGQIQPDERASEKILQLAADDDAYFYLRDSALRVAAGDIFNPRVRTLLVKRANEANSTAINLLGTYGTERFLP